MLKSVYDVLRASGVFVLANFVQVQPEKNWNSYLFIYLFT